MIFFLFNTEKDSGTDNDESIFDICLYAFISLLFWSMKYLPDPFPKDVIQVIQFENKSPWRMHLLYNN